MAKVCGTPKHQFRSVLAACGFGNSTGLPITLLIVIHSNFPVTSDLGRIDPTLFLSVFLLLYPVLQWGLGGWLLAPDVDQDPAEVVDESNGASTSFRLPERSVSGSFRQHVLNNTSQKGFYKNYRGLSSADEGIYMTEV